MARDWSDEEESQLARLYGSAPVREMLPLFPGRTKRAIMKKALKLGLRGMYREKRPTIEKEPKERKPRVYGWFNRDYR